MKINFNLNNTVYSCDTSKPIEISIPVMFNGEQPNTYNVDKASSKAYESGEFIGDTRRGADVTLKNTGSFLTATGLTRNVSAIFHWKEYLSTKP
ncbi:MAG: hypothetical protein R2942_01015 [Ignavibacteria bacterium]